MNNTVEGNEDTNLLFNSSLPAESDKQILGIVYLVMSVLVMAANGVVIFVIVKTRELHLPTLWIITNMAVWDFCYGLHYLIFAVPSAFLNRFAYSNVLMGFATYFITLISSQIALNTALTVVDRFIAVQWPLKYTQIATKNKYTFVVSVTLLLGLSRFLDMQFNYNTATAVCRPTFNASWGKIVTAVLFTTALVIIILCSILILREIMQSRRKVRQETSTGLPKEKMIKSSMMIILSAGVYCVATIPQGLYSVLASVYKNEAIFGWLEQLSMVALLSNSLWNVFIYTATYRPFREAFLSIFCKSYHRRRRQVEIQDTFKSSQEVELHA